MQWVFAISFAMLLLLFLANVIAFQYGGGAARAAADTGARYGALFGNDAGHCMDRAESVLRGDGGLLRGTLGDSVTVACSRDGDVMRATVAGVFEWWIGGLPPVEFTVVGQALVEELPP